jgi:hypothetical protein
MILFELSISMSWDNMVRISRWRACALAPYLASIPNFRACSLRDLWPTESCHVTLAAAPKTQKLLLLLLVI